MLHACIAWNNNGYIRGIAILNIQGFCEVILNKLNPTVDFISVRASLASIRAEDGQSIMQLFSLEVLMEKAVILTKSKNCLIGINIVPELQTPLDLWPILEQLLQYTSICLPNFLLFIYSYFEIIVCQILWKEILFVCCHHWCLSWLCSGVRLPVTLGECRINSSIDFDI